MAVDHIRYDILAQEALRGVVRTVLLDAAKSGLPGEHHFYISFDTRADGVRLSPRMLAQYPEEMTVVLQHQFWDLVVTDDGFEVGLSFGGIPERLAIPFAAIKGFFDPSVQFGLQFEDITAGETQGAQPGNAGAADSAGKSAARPPAEHRRSPPALAAVPTPANPEPAAAKPSTNKPDANKSDAQPDDGPDKPPGSGEVVRLDRFRKK
jgi:uncharacterized protein